MTKLVLFDIDGTLINASGVGRDSVTQAFEEVFSIKDAFLHIHMAGKTDIQIIKEALLAHGLPTNDGVIPKILSRYTDILKKEISTHDMYINPGVIDLLNHLKTTEGFFTGLLTGNIEAGGRIKLGKFDLNRYFPFGAFGDDDADRNKLLPVAVEKFSAMTQINISFRDCIVIGDTPKDVQCARPYGAISMAVSTGPYSYEELLETGADHVLKDLSPVRTWELFTQEPGRK